MKKLLSFFIFFLFTFSFAAQAATFPDIKSPVLLEAVNYLNEKGIIKGYPDGTFKPDQVINRAEALKIIFESRGIAVESDTNSGFPDVDANLWFAIYVTSAKKLGLIQGYGDGTYKPTQFVNKAEFIKIAMLAQQYYENPADLSVATRQYTDLSSSEWYAPYVAFALENNFLDKVSKLSPTAGMTRGEAALMVYKIINANNENYKTRWLSFLTKHNRNLGNYDVRLNQEEYDFKNLEPSFRSGGVQHNDYAFFSGYEGYIAYYKIPNFSKKEGVIDLRMPGYYLWGTSDIFKSGKFGYIFTQIGTTEDHYELIDWMFVIDLENKKLVENKKANFHDERLFRGFDSPDIIDENNIYQISIYPTENQIVEINENLDIKTLKLGIDYTNIPTELIKNEYENEGFIDIEELNFQHTETSNEKFIYIIYIVLKPYEYHFIKIDKEKFTIANKGMLPDVIGNITDVQNIGKEMIILSDKGLFSYDEDLNINKKLIFDTTSQILTHRFFVVDDILIYLDAQNYDGEGDNKYFFNKISLTNFKPINRSKEAIPLTDVEMGNNYFSINKDKLYIYSGFIMEPWPIPKEMGAKIFIVNLDSLEITEEEELIPYKNYAHMVTNLVISDEKNNYIFLSKEYGLSAHTGLESVIYKDNINSTTITVPKKINFYPYAILCKSVVNCIYKKQILEK